MIELHQTAGHLVVKLAEIAARQTDHRLRGHLIAEDLVVILLVRDLLLTIDLLVQDHQVMRLYRNLVTNLLELSLQIEIHHLLIINHQVDVIRIIDPQKISLQAKGQENNSSRASKG